MGSACGGEEEENSDVDIDTEGASEWYPFGAVPNSPISVVCICVRLVVETHCVQRDVRMKSRKSTAIPALNPLPHLAATMKGTAKQRMERRRTSLQWVKRQWRAFNLQWRRPMILSSAFISLNIPQITFFGPYGKTVWTQSMEMSQSICSGCNSVDVCPLFSVLKVTAVYMLLLRARLERTLQSFS